MCWCYCLQSLKTADLAAGQWVAISGAGGGLGSLAVQYARAMGLRVVAIDGGDEKVNLLNHWVLKLTLISPKIKILLKLSKATDGGPHGAINVSVSEKPLTNLLNMLDH